MRLLITFAFLSIFTLSAQAQNQTTCIVDLRTGIPYAVNLPLPSGPTITVNGYPVQSLNLIGDFDPGTNTLALSRETVTGKGAQSEGSATVQGTLTVTSACLLNTHDGVTTLGSSSVPNAGVLALWDGHTHKVTIKSDSLAANDTITIPDAGGNAKFLLEVAPPVNATDAGVVGNVAHDNAYWYWYTSTGWIRVAGATW